MKNASIYNSIDMLYNGSPLYKNTKEDIYAKIAGMIIMILTLTMMIA